jgi:predicted signal transduction protein with EAL and GGDEF domain
MLSSIAMRASGSRPYKASFIALFLEHGNTFEELLSRADSAMYEAKGAGRNCFRVYAIDGEPSGMTTEELRERDSAL